MDKQALDLAEEPCNDCGQLTLNRNTAGNCADCAEAAGQPLPETDEVCGCGFAPDSSECQAIHNRDQDDYAK